VSSELHERLELEYNGVSPFGQDLARIQLTNADLSLTIWSVRISRKRQQEATRRSDVNPFQRMSENSIVRQYLR
jgi:hypothetical protein